MVYELKYGLYEDPEHLNAYYLWYKRIELHVLGEKVKRITQAIATKICRSEMPYDLSANALCDLMDKQGDLEFWLQAERCVLID